MMTARGLIVLGMLALAAAGCSAVDKLTGSGVDNTVLSGQREDAIPGRNQFPDTSDPGVTRAGQGQEPPPADAGSGCAPDDPGCKPPSGNDTFSDPQ